MSDAWTAFARDLADAARDLADTSGPEREASELLAVAISGEAPVDTGYLASSVSPTGDGVYVAAPYAGYVEAFDGFTARAIDSTDWAAPFEEHAENALNSNLRSVYTA